MERIVLSPCEVAALPWAVRPDVFRVSVVVRATFALAHGREATLIEPQGAPDGDVWWDRAPSGSLYLPADRVPYKPRADVLLVGHARAPGGVAVESLVVSLRVDDFSKSLRVHGDRAREQARDGARPARATPFVEIPLRYERAAARGDNPLGASGGGWAAAGGGLPNIEPLDDDKPWITPGFGPIAPAWRAARDRTPEAALRWAQAFAESGAPPPGFDFGFFNAAPRDQQVERVAANASITLENLHPSAPRFEARLPGIAPRAFWVDPKAGVADVPLRLDTLWIDADRSLALVSWRGAAAEGPPGAHERCTLHVAMQQPGEQLRFADLIARALRPQRQAKPGGASALAETNEMSERLQAIVGAKQALPFAASAAGRAPAPPSSRGGLPFSGELLARPPVLSAGPLATTIAPIDHPPASAPPPPSWVEPPREDAPRAGEPPAAPAAPPWMAEAPPLAEPPRPFEPPPPAEPPAPADLSPLPEPRPSPIEPAPPAPPEPTREALVDLPIAVCAAISAELDLGGDLASRALASRGVAPDAWRAHQARWGRAMEAEELDGGAALRVAFDDAYVARVEEARGALTPDDLARLVAGRARKGEAPLAGAALPAAGLFRLKRVALRRIAGDAALGAAVQRAAGARGR